MVQCVFEASGVSLQCFYIAVQATGSTPGLL